MFHRIFVTHFAVLVLLIAGIPGLMTAGMPVVLNSSDDLFRKVEPGLLEVIQAKGSADLVLQFAEHADLSAAERMDWQARGEWVFSTLHQIADRNQVRAVTQLDQRGFKYYSSFAANRIYVWDGDLELLTRLTQLPEVEYIRAPKTIVLNQLYPNRFSAFPDNPLQILAMNAHFNLPDEEIPQEMSWGLVDTQADEFWNTYQMQGEGIVVAGIDTGVQYNHPALDQAYKCQNDPGSPVCWFDPNNDCGGIPCDDNGHGTATMGPIVADDDPALPYQVGMAPEAQWIACKGCSGSGGCSEFGLVSCAEWILAPGADPANRPQVVSNSWGGACEDGDWFLPYVNAWAASGIAASFSPGGSGPSCGTIGSPAAYQQVFAPTAHDGNRVIASFASRGPGCKGDFLKPNISAPGVNLNVPVPTNYWENYSGTSFSNSYGAGAMVLLLSCSPDLIGLPNDLMNALQETSDEPPPGNCGAPPDGEGNYTYGAGYINMLETGAQHCDALDATLEGYVQEAWTEISLAGATVYISPTAVTTTDISGYYSFTLPIGVYTATASLTGYEPLTITDIEIDYSGTFSQDFGLLRIGEWTTGPTDPNEINRSDCVWFDDASGIQGYNEKVYCMGGRTSPSTEDPSIWVFDPRTSLFSDTGDIMIEDVSNYTTNVLQDDGGWAIYVVGGYSADTGAYVDYVQRYAPLSGEISLVSTDPWPLKIGLVSANPGGCAVVQNKIYCFGGFETSVAPYFSAETWEYDPYRTAGERWQQVLTTNLGLPRGYIDVAVQNDIIYAMGGIYQYAGSDLVPTNVMEALDINNLEAGWLTLASLPVATAEGRGFGFSADTLTGITGDWAGKLYTVGGGDWPDYSAEVMEYDIVTNAWDQSFPDLIQARKNMAGVYIPLCTENPYDGLPGMWVIAGYVGSCYPPFAQPEYYPFTCDPQAEIELVKTVGSEVGECAETDVISVPVGANVTYCFELINSGEITLTLHDLTDSQLGEIWAGHELEIPAWSSVYVTHTTQISATTINTATWTASDGQGIILECSDTALVNVLQPSIVFSKTVGVEPGICAVTDMVDVLAGSQVVYCFQVLNNGPITITDHDLVDSHLGKLFTAHRFELAPGEGTQYLTSTMAVTDVINTAIWTAYPDNGAPVAETDSAIVTAHEQLGLILTKTVGLDPAVCAETDLIEVSSGMQVYYCYTVKNMGDVPLVFHDLIDSQLGDLLIGYIFELLPGETTIITSSALINSTVVNTAIWTASTAWGTHIEVGDTASVLVGVSDIHQVFLPAVVKNR